MSLIQTVKKLSEELYPEIVEIRRHLHSNPELSFQEHNTADYIANILEKEGITCKRGIAGTGLLAEVEGSKPGKIIGLRADMDALPIQEENDVEYRSLVDGRMHACGHDAHSASLIGTALILKRLKTEFPAKVKLVVLPG